MYGASDVGSTVNVTSLDELSDEALLSLKALIIVRDSLGGVGSFAEASVSLVETLSVGKSLSEIGKRQGAYPIVRDSLGGVGSFTEASVSLVETLSVGKSLSETGKRQGAYPIVANCGDYGTGFVETLSMGEVLNQVFQRTGAHPGVRVIN